MLGRSPVRSSGGWVQIRIGYDDGGGGNTRTVIWGMVQVCIGRDRGGKNIRTVVRGEVQIRIGCGGGGKRYPYGRLGGWSRSALGGEREVRCPYGRQGCGFWSA